MRQEGRLVDDGRMFGARRLLSLLVLSGCAGSGTASSSSEPPVAGHAAAATVDAPSVLDAEIVQVAATAPHVHKMKVRVAPDGAVVKLSVYHDDVAAIPKPVLDLAAERFPGLPVTHYESELYAEYGRVYEVEVDKDGVACELAASAEGIEIYTECHIDPATLSDAAKATLEQVAPGGKVLEAETKTGPQLDEITVEVEHQGQEFYVRLRADGSLIEVLRRIPAVVEVPVP